ncbi:MAG TPA: hypothetical protein VMD98_13580 [Bryocella sp.]|nr:hypothetical protein [Bryocella sp.]
MRCGLRALSWAGLAVALLAAPVAYAGTGDQVHIGGKSINVGPDEHAGDLVCIGCSIRMLGSCGDVVAIGGSVDVNGSTHDVVVIGGGLRLEENAFVAGDAVTVGGRLWRDPSAVVHGQVSVRSGILVLLWLVLVPSVPIILIVALLIWLLRPNRQPTQVGV